MKEKLTRKGSIAMIALTGALAALAVGIATSSAAARPAPPPDVAVDYRPSGWAPASELEDSGNGPSLTSVEHVEGSNSSEPWLGYGLVAVGLLTLGIGLTAAARMPRRIPRRSDSDTDRPRRRSTAGTYAGP